MKKKSQRGGARAGAGRKASGRRQVTYWLDGTTVERLDKIVPERIWQARVIDAAVCSNPATWANLMERIEGG